MCGGRPDHRAQHAIRTAVGDEIDLMVDVHGPPWLTPADAIALGKALEPYHLLFYEDPIAPENFDALAKVAANVNLPIAAGERHAGMHGVRQLIEQEIIDVVQPDTGRAGGLWQMLKLAHMAEAHHIMVAPHSGSLGPVAEMATVHLMACLPNFLILEHLDGDVPQRFEVMTNSPSVVVSVDGHRPTSVLPAPPRSSPVEKRLPRAGQLHRGAEPPGNRCRHRRGRVCALSKPRQHQRPRCRPRLHLCVYQWLRLLLTAVVVYSVPGVAPSCRHIPQKRACAMVGPAGKQRWSHERRGG